MIKTVVSYQTSVFNDLLSFCNDLNIIIDRLEPDDFLNNNFDNKNRSYINLIFRDFSLRHKVGEKLDKDNETLWNFIHPLSSVSSSAKLSNGIFVYPFTTVLSNAVISSHTILHSYSKVSHSTKLGKGTVLCSYSNISGSCDIGNYCLFYPYSNVADNCKIVDFCTISAYSNIRKDIDISGKYAVVQNKLRKIP